VRAGDYWKRLVRKIEYKEAVKPDEFEIYNGTIVFWFNNEGTALSIVKKIKEKDLNYEVRWDSEGLIGIALKRELLS
jgi:hypothetical protein